MAARFAVVNGMAGTGVQQALRRYADWCSRNDLSPPSIISLEDDHLVPLARDTVSKLHPRFQPADVTIMEVLQLPKPLLMEFWSKAFDEALIGIRESLASEQPVILTFHAAWFHLGEREYMSGIDFGRLANLKERPDIVFTLVDDIYDVKARLSRRHGLFSYNVDEPDDYHTAVLRLLRILDWRNTENVLASKVAEITESPHFVLAVKHPIVVFHNLFVGTDKKLVYVAHPISEIRRLNRGTEEQKILAEQVVERVQDLCVRLSEHFIVIEPTAIDELRFDFTVDFEDQSIYLPQLGWRWPLPSDEASDLLFEAPQEPDDAFGPSWAQFAQEIADIGIENLDQTQNEKIRQAWPSLKALQEQILEQITARDYSLVTQASGLAVYRPAFRGNESGGVQREITHHRILQQAGLDRAKVVILHPEADERDTLVSNFKRIVDSWQEAGILQCQPAQIASLKSDLTFDQLQSIQDANTDLSKGQAISELLGKFGIEILTRTARAMAPDPSVVAREEESERGKLFAGLQSYISSLIITEDVEVIREDLSIIDFAQRVVNRIN
ncbi:MAG: hypothetical protein IIA92_02370 [Chloroflexi bacterium]|nr:hypothetical protein [Chloroflexota bacterium]